MVTALVGVVHHVVPTCWKATIVVQKRPAGKNFKRPLKLEDRPWWIFSTLCLIPGHSLQRWCRLILLQVQMNGVATVAAWGWSSPLQTRFPGHLDPTGPWHVSLDMLLKTITASYSRDDSLSSCFPRNPMSIPVNPIEIQCFQMFMRLESCLTWAAHQKSHVLYQFSNFSKNVVDQW